MEHGSNSHNAIQIVLAGMVSAARLVAARLTDAFGSPSALVANGALYGEARLRVLRWLNDLESVVRRFLLLRACLFPPPDPRESAPINTQVANEHAPRPLKSPFSGEGDPYTLYGPPEDSAQWRVSYRLLAPNEPGWQSPLSGRAPRRPKRFNPNPQPQPVAVWADDPRPVAERFEALLRVIAEPDWYAERLAARLHAWRGRAESRGRFLRGLNGAAQIANEAGLEEEAWEAFAEARDITKALMSVFSTPVLRPLRSAYDSG